MGIGFYSMRFFFTILIIKNKQRKKRKKEAFVCRSCCNIFFQMNLASQSILEGLNACFDHRHQLFIPELNRMFEIGSSSHNSKFFACQNPHNLGGNRRALPKSFLNRFSVVSVSFQSL